MMIQSFLLRVPYILQPLLRLLLCLFLLLNLYACDNAGNTKPKHDHSQHQHGLLEVTSFGDEVIVPAVDFTIAADSMSGWNIHIQTDNFRFTPEQINADAVSNEGHAHLYIDGLKIARLYGPWYHLKKLTPGEHTLRISLNANDHSEWSHQGKAIAKSQILIQPY